MAPRTARQNLKQVAACLVSAFMVSALLAVPHEVHARRHVEPEVMAPGLQQAVALSALPKQAQDVHRRILVGGPFRYEKDGTVFGNRERILPRQPRGFYREYTVPTPGERTRGARRIVCGGKDVQRPETCYYTRDHYSSFNPIDPQR